MSEPARDDDCFLAIPRRVVGHDARMRGDVLRRQLRQLVGLCVHPAKRLEVAQVLVLRQQVRQVHGLVRTPLRRHHDTANLLDLRVVGRADAVQVTGNLEKQEEHNVVISQQPVICSNKYNGS